MFVLTNTQIKRMLSAFVNIVQEVVKMGKQYVWKETLWSKVQPEIVATKWKNAINAMENMED